MSGDAAGRDNWTRKYAPATLRAALWTALSLRRARRLLKAEGLHARIPPPPRLPFGATRGVNAILRRTEPTCLERAAVLQTWLAAHGHPVDIVIGVRSSDKTMAAHAWIDSGGNSADGTGFVEIARIGPPPASA